MNRPADRTWIWILLGAFTLFSICLPLGHDCLKPALRIAESASHGFEVTLGSGPQLQRLSENHRDDICQACLLAQNLLLDRAAVKLIGTGTAESNLDRISTPILAAADHYQSASKRAPPAAL